MVEYILYCDESERQGRYFGNFYGGALVRGSDLNMIISILEDKRNEYGLKEVKWSKTSPNYLEAYMDLMSIFFDFIERNKIKVRIMFTQNCYQPSDLTKEQREHSFFILYYQFLKHAFGLQYSNNMSNDIRLKFYFDRLPDTKEKAARFKDFVYNLQFQPDFQSARLTIRREDITDVDSHNHIILQCTDVILGSMQFRLNDRHREKPAGKRFRGKKTVAKERLYQFIAGRISSIYPHFNIGTSTGCTQLSDRWNHSYRHWRFVPNDRKTVPYQSKHKQKAKGPILPT